MMVSHIQEIAYTILLLTFTQGVCQFVALL